MKSIDGDCGGGESKVEKSLRLDKVKQSDTHFFYVVHTGPLIMNTYSTQSCDTGNKVTKGGSVVSPLL